jgi:hypothetical protein
MNGQTNNHEQHRRDSGQEDDSCEDNISRRESRCDMTVWVQVLIGSDMQKDTWDIKLRVQVVFLSFLFVDVLKACLAN